MREIYGSTRRKRQTGSIMMNNGRKELKFTATPRRLAIQKCHCCKLTYANSSLHYDLIRSWQRPIQISLPPIDIMAFIHIPNIENVSLWVVGHANE